MLAVCWDCVATEFWLASEVVDVAAGTVLVVEADTVLAVGVALLEVEADDDCEPVEPVV